MSSNAAILSGGVTPGQRRALFAYAKAHYLDIEDLRAMTSGGSISKLSRAEASAILERLNRGGAYDHPRPAKPREKRRPKGVYRMFDPNGAQARKIEALRVDLGWTRERLVEFLGERTHKDGGPLTRLHSTADASTVIELLKGVLQRQEAAQARRRRAKAVREAEN